MRCRTGNNLDVFLFHQGTERTEDIAIEDMEQVQGLVVEPGPIVGQPNEVILVQVAKVRRSLSTRSQAGIEKDTEFLLQLGTGELLTQDRREAYCKLRRETMLGEGTQGSQ